MRAHYARRRLITLLQATRQDPKEIIRPLKDQRQPDWQHSSGSSLSKKKINKRTLELLKGHEKNVRYD